MSGVRGAHPGVAGAGQFADVMRAAGPEPAYVERFGPRPTPLKPVGDSLASR